MNQSDQEYISSAKSEIDNWEKEGPGYVAQVGSAILWPAEKAAEFLIPAGIMEAAGKAIEGCLIGLGSVSTYTFDHQAILKSVEVQQKKESSDGFAARLKAADVVARDCWNWNVGFAALQGGASGAAGLPGMVANIPTLFGITLRSIQQIGLCYGYNTLDPKEFEYLLQILRTGASGDIKAKLEFLMMLKQFEQILLKVAWKAMGAELAAKQISQQSLLAALRAFAKTLGIQLTKRKALQMIPIIGAVIGAAFDSVFVNDIGKAAYMCYRRRFIEENEFKNREDDSQVG